ncbi:MAG TPA: hypothetical protein VFS72_10730 [Agromyces sp.]|nr:hypothetical protein [Agromyces sp.]
MTHPRDLPAEDASILSPLEAVTQDAAHLASEPVSQVAMAESELRRLGLEDVRVHHHGDLARLELPSSGLGAISTGLLREEVLRSVRAAGFRFVTVDLDDPS